jgi:hypothetical protein
VHTPVTASDANVGCPALEGPGDLGPGTARKLPLHASRRRSTAPGARLRARRGHRRHRCRRAALARRATSPPAHRSAAAAVAELHSITRGRSLVSAGPACCSGRRRGSRMVGPPRCRSTPPGQICPGAWGKSAPGVAILGVSWDSVPTPCRIRHPAEEAHAGSPRCGTKGRSSEGKVVGGASVRHPFAVMAVQGCPPSRGAAKLT